MMLKSSSKVKRLRKLRSSYFLIILFLAGNGFSKPLPADKVLKQFSFGSCQRVEKDLGIYKTIGKLKPQLMVLMGDNIYAGTVEDKEKRYSELKENPDFKKFFDKTPTYAIWDDNDYGKSDTGSEYPYRKETEKLFKNFWGLAESLSGQEGIYQSYIFGPEGKRVQFILLDTRSFRSRPKLSPTPLPIGLYVPNEDKSTTILGEKQWKWLEEELKKPAELRFIVTGYQFLVKELNFECWMNFPHERERMLETIKKANAGGVVFLSGDRHIAMILHDGDLWEFTSSGLTEALPDTAPVAPESTLDGKLYFGQNFGFASIDWKGRAVKIQIRDPQSRVVREKRLTFKSLNVAPQVK